MSHRRTALVAAAVLAVGTLSLLPTRATSHAVDRTPELTHSQVAALTPDQPMKGRAWIQGVVKDQFGDPVGNVEVRATSANGGGSAITYEEPGIAGSTGFYRIYDLAPGTYTLSFTASAPKIVPTTTTVRVGKRDIGKASVTVTRVLAATDVTGSLKKKTVTTKQSGAVEVTLKTAATKSPTGRIEVREGSAVVGRGSLVVGNAGRLTISLDRLAKGAHVLKVHYLGSTSLRGSTSKPLTLVVTKARR